MHKYVDPWSYVVIAATLVLFVAALLTKGFTHDLFLEAGVFLVSAKVILMAYHNRRSVERLEQKLDAILSAVEKRTD